MLIGMNLAVGPVGRIKARGLERSQDRLLFALEDLERYSAGRPMNAAACRIPAPDHRSTRDVAQVDERLALEETFADKTHSIFDDGLISGMPRPGRVRQKAAVI